MANYSLLRRAVDSVVTEPSLLILLRATAAVLCYINYMSQPLLLHENVHTSQGYQTNVSCNNTRRSTRVQYVFEFFERKFTFYESRTVGLCTKLK